MYKNYKKFNSANQTLKKKKQSGSFSHEHNSAVSTLISSGDIIDCPIDTSMISDYLREPMLYNQELRKLSWWAYRTNGIVSSGVDYMRSMHTLDKVVYSKKESSKSVSAKRKKNKEHFEAVLETIKYKKFIREALLKCFNDGIIFYYFETTALISDNQKYLSDIDTLNITEINQIGINASIVALPVDWCKIIGKRNNSYVIAFDLRYFQGLSPEDRDRKVKSFPKEIRNAWDKYDSGKIEKPWVRLDNNKTIVHKIKSADNEQWGVPLAIASLDDILYANHFITTKRNILDDLNNQIFYETYPEGERKGSCSLSQSQQEAQHNLIKNALFNNKNSYGKAFFSLASGTKLDQIKVDTDIFNEKNESGVKNDISQDLGIESSILGGQSQSNYATASLNIESISSFVYGIITDIVDEINKVINANIIKDNLNITKMWIMPVTFVNRDKMVKYMGDLYARGKGSLQAWVASTGMDVEAYMALMEQELEDDYENHFPVHKTSFTLTSSDSNSSDIEESGGAPSENNPVNPNTIASKTSNGNNNPKPSV